MWRKFLCYLGRPFAKSKFRFVINPNVAGQDEGAAELFEQLGLRAAQVDLLFTAFKKIDLAQRGKSCLCLGVQAYASFLIV